MVCHIALRFTELQSDAGMAIIQGLLQILRVKQMGKESSAKSPALP